MNFSSFKHSDFNKALDFSLKLETLGNSHFLLVPVGDWILSNDELIGQMASWRQKHMKFFFAQFDSSAEKTKTYLKKYSIDQSDRLLFIIFSAEGEALGHLGFSNLMDETCELDNVMRGDSKNAPRGIMGQAIERIILWIRELIPLKSIELQVLEENIQAVKLYSRLGFVLVKRNSLYPQYVQDLTIWRPSNVYNVGKYGLVLRLNLRE